MLIYLLKFTICLAILYFFYKICLENEHMHVFKRIYLLASLVAALLIPALVFNEYVEVLPTSYVTAQEYAVPQATAGPIGIPQALEKDVLDIEPILWTVYFIGVLFFGVKFLKNLIQIGRRIQKNPKQKWEQFIHVLLNDALPPHTFLSYIFLNKQKFEAQEIPKEVLLHEQTHARQRHSYDILFVEFLQVIFWINPFIYLLKKAIKLNHEFLADEAVLNKNISKSNYQNTLLSYLSEDNQHHQSPLVNPINYSSIKKRFTIMKTKTSRKAVLLRSILLLPLFSLLLIGFSETKVVHEQIKSDTNNLIQINDIPPPIKIHINEKQEITIEEEVIAVEDISQKLSQIIKSDSSKPNSVREVYIEAKGNLNLKLLTSIKEQITKEGYILKTVTADIVQVMNKTLENYRGIEFIARDTFHLKQDDGTFVLGFTTKENPVISQTNSSTITVQDSATTKELAEYTKLAKHYNSMSGNKMKIYKKDVERLEYLFSKMSKKQKATAEPFPDFPVPPPAPKAPRAVNEREEALHTIETIIENQDPYDNVHANIMSEENVRVYQYTSKREPTEKINLELYAEKLGLTDAKFYFEGEKISTNKGLKIIKDGNIKVETFPYKNKQPEVRIYKSESKGTIPPPPHSPEAPKVLKGSVSTIAPPPSTVVIKGTASSIPQPPKPITPLDHVIAMAKKDATFLYEGKEISSDRAINLMKTNKDLNIDSRTTKGKKPVVKISIEPIAH